MPTPKQMEKLAATVGRESLTMRTAVCTLHDGKQTEEAREHAARAYSLLDKEAWLRVAEEWLKVALSAEERDRK
jgi:hypothetical protein